ncbi:MAG TPA: serine/threonine-protein kinase [Gemmataceae bacterium]|nr:serine/threonine-protein kinase [Gemmataceae bacterium]
MPATSPCPDGASLQQLLLGRLPLSDGEPLYDHLDECDRCAEFARTFRSDDWLSDVVRDAGGGTEAENASAAALIAALEEMGPPDRFDFLAPPQAPDELGRLGGYRILKVLGAGGMGVVFHAEDPALRRAVAVKAMRPGLAASAAARRRFLREGQAAAALHHDHIVPIFQVGEDRGVPFIAMPLLRGETLEDRLQRGTTLPTAEVFGIGREIALGLAAAHAKGLIHRDIKPANIWLESDEPNTEGNPMQATASSIAPASSSYRRVKILDFGLARPTADAKLTQEGAIVGTPAYMAPEQAAGAAVDARSDLFSLGCVLYRLTAGATPFKGDDAVAVLLSVARDNPRPPAEVNPAVPPPLSGLVMRLLAKAPADRPASAREVIERLTKAKAESEAPRMHRWGWRRWSLLAVALTLGIGAIAAMGVHFSVQTDRGVVTVETDDPNVEIVATKGGKLVRIVDPQSKQTWELDPQKYELRMADQPDGLTIALDGKAPFVLKRKGEKLVTITVGEGAASVRASRLPPWVTDRMEEKYRTDRDFKTPILPPVQQGAPPPKCEEEPGDARILRALEPAASCLPFVCEEFRDNIEITKERIIDTIDPPRFFPLVGQAQLHHCHWKCTVHYDETVECRFPLSFRCTKPRKTVVYIDLDHLHLAPG